MIARASRGARATARVARTIPTCPCSTSTGIVRATLAVALLAPWSPSRSPWQSNPLVDAVDQHLDQDGGSNRSIGVAGGGEDKHSLLDTGREGGLEGHVGRERGLALADRSRGARLSNFIVEVIQHDDLADLPFNSASHEAEERRE